MVLHDQKVPLGGFRGLFLCAYMVQLNY